MSVFHVAFEGVLKGPAPIEHPFLTDGSPVILEERPLPKRSCDTFTVVAFTIDERREAIRKMFTVLEDNPEAISWSVVNEYDYAVLDIPLTRYMSSSRNEPGKDLIVYYSPSWDCFGYYFRGIGRNGQPFETDHVDGYRTDREATVEGLAAWSEETNDGHLPA